MLGYTNESPHGIFLNHTLIIGKQEPEIYSSRIRKSKPLLSQFIVKLEHIECIEHYIAKRRDRINFHEKKWKIIRNLFLILLSYCVVVILSKQCSGMHTDVSNSSVTRLDNLCNLWCNISLSTCSLSTCRFMQF